ncbi:MAG: hypothetical protein HPAVJP_5330 [Candidatus Hepatoplasma vulgare]|nr:MAG: hypothetical protein HPAVJP_5330 [Candidatus Hepatoplasma sp.]
MSSKEISKLWPRFIGWFFIGILSVAFGVDAIVNSIQKMIDVSDSEDGWDTFVTVLVALLYLLECFLFVFFIYYSVRKTILIHRNIETIKEETGIKAKKEQAKAAKKAKKKEKEAKKNAKKEEKK